MVLKKDLVIYPAIFSKTDQVVTVNFPDIPAINTFGENETEATAMAMDALGLALVGEKKRPTVSKIDQLNVKKGQWVVMIAVDLQLAQKQIVVPTVHKNVTIPVALDKEARAQKINFSAVLTKALRQLLA